MTERMTERLQRARRGVFVGRATEIEIFNSSLKNRASEWRVLHVFGPGGIGKSALLREFVAQCQARDAVAVSLDAREIEPQPQAFERAVSAALGSDEKPLDFLARQTRRHVLFFDTYERLTPLDSWLRETFFPQLPDAHRVVIAGRNAPREGWKFDSGWQDLLRVLPLKNLDRDESHLLLSERGVPKTQHNRVLDFTHGHPLALTLVADTFDQRRSGKADKNVAFAPQEAPEIVNLLVTHLVEEVPSLAQRAALEACALVRWTTEALLSHVLSETASPQTIAPPLSQTEIAALFDWLRSLSFIESGALGLCPHDMAREALVANFRWRNAPLYADFHRLARDFYASQLRSASPSSQQRILADYIFLHHDNAMIRPFLQWQEGSELTSSAPRENDISQLLEIIRRHKNENEAQIAAFWCARQPDSFFVIRNAQHEIEGFWCQLALHRTSAAERQNDEISEKAWQILQATPPLKAHESATLFRLWMARDANQNVGAVQSLIFVNIVRHYLTTPNLAFSLLLCDDAEFWAPIFRYAGADFSVFDDEKRGSSTGIYSHDWRAVPPLAWLDRMAQQEIDASNVAPAAEISASQTIAPGDTARFSPAAMDESEFALAVRDALKSLHRPAALERNALLCLRMISIDAVPQSSKNGGAASEAQKIARLQHLVRRACEMLRDSGKTDKWYQALRWRYLEPLTTQEAAAERMDVPFGTFRRYLKTGVERVTETLWQWEKNGAAPADLDTK